MSFYQLYPGAPLPDRVDRSRYVSLPLEAYRHWERSTTACGFGWYVFPPLDFVLVWDGVLVRFRPVQEDEWQLVGRVRGPGEPLDLLATLVQPGVVRVWTGLMARTQSPWSLLVRAPANLPGDPAYEVLEGVVETDRDAVPIVSHIRLWQPGRPMVFTTARPMLQLQPVHRDAYSVGTLYSAEARYGMERAAAELPPDRDCAPARDRQLVVDGR